MIRGLVLLVALGGCAAPMYSIQRGPVGNSGFFLVTVTVVEWPQTEEWCGQGSRGCWRSVKVWRGDREVQLHQIVVARDLDGRVPEERLVHEFCHALASAQQVTPDPCHAHGTGD